MAYGRKVLGVVGAPYQALAGPSALRKLGGVTLDWTTFAAAAGSDTTLYDNWVVPAGVQYCKTGQVVCLITSVVNGSTVGKYGPWDIAASDGRQTLTKGSCFVVNRGVMSNDPKGEYPDVFYGGLVWLPRVVQSGVATHTLAAGPTLAEFLAAFPMIETVNEAS